MPDVDDDDRNHDCDTPPRCCPGPCNRHHSRRGLAVGPTVGWGNPVWCLACTLLVELALADLGRLYEQLGEDIGHLRATGSAEVTSRSVEPPSPSPQIDNQDELVRFLQSWEDLVRERRTMPPAARLNVSLARQMDSALHVLTVHSAWLLTQLDVAADFGREVLAERHRLQRATHTATVREHLPAPCPKCDGRGLWRFTGQNAVHCSLCGQTMTWDDYADAVDPAVHVSGL